MHTGIEPSLPRLSARHTQHRVASLRHVVPRTPSKPLHLPPGEAASLAMEVEPSPPQRQPPRRLMRPTPADGPVRSTDDAMSRSLARSALRNAITRFSPVAVLRECLGVFADNPDTYGALWGLLLSEYQRAVKTVGTSPECFWGHVARANKDYLEERQEQQRGAEQNARVHHMEAQLARSHAEQARIQQECDRLMGKTREVETAMKDIVYARDNLSHELATTKAELVRVNSRNVQLQAVYDTYIEADDKKMGEEQIKLLEQVEQMKQNVELASERQKESERRLQATEELLQDKELLYSELKDQKLHLEHAQRRVHAELKAVTDERDQLQSMLQDYMSQQQEQQQRKLSSVSRADSIIADGGSLKPAQSARAQKLKRRMSESRVDRKRVDVFGKFQQQVPQLNPVEEVEYFIGRGHGRHVPEYLRYHGKVRNRKIRKGELERLINTLWKEKARHEDTSGRKIALADFFSIFLTQLHGQDLQMRAEHAYSICDAAERYKADADCELFITVLRGEVPEDVYHDQMNLILTVRMMLDAADEAAHGSRTGELTHALVKGVLPKAIPLLTPWRFQALCEALKQDFPGDVVQHQSLFASDKEGNQGNFAEELRDQHLHMTQAYIADICDVVGRFCNEHSEVSWDDVRIAWLRIDPAQSDQIHAVCCKLAKGMGVPAPPVWGEGKPERRLSDPNPIPFQRFQEAFSTVFVKRRGPDPTGGENRWNPMDRTEELPLAASGDEQRRSVASELPAEESPDTEFGVVVTSPARVSIVDRRDDEKQKPAPLAVLDVSSPKGKKHSVSSPSPVKRKTTGRKRDGSVVSPTSPTSPPGTLTRGPDSPAGRGQRPSRQGLK